MLEFTYYFNQIISNNIPAETSFPNSQSSFTLVPLKSNIIDLDNNITFQLYIAGQTINQITYETYTISATSTSNQSTIGSIQWISSYASLPIINQFTSVPKLVSSITFASGIFSPYAQKNVTVYYNNNSLLRTIII